MVEIIIRGFGLSRKKIDVFFFFNAVVNFVGFVKRHGGKSGRGWWLTIVAIRGW